MRQATYNKAPIICTAIRGTNIRFKMTEPSVCYNLLSSTRYMRHHHTKSANIEGLSIYHQQNEKKEQPASRKHLLGLMSSFTKEKPDIKSEETEELCCFDRMKKLIVHNQVTGQAEKKDQISSIVIERKINHLEGELTKKMAGKVVTPKLHQRTNSATNFHQKPVMIEAMKKGCLIKYIAHQVGKREKQVEDVRKIIDREANMQVDSLIQDKGLRLIKFKEENEVLKKQILELDLQIEGFRSKEAHLQDYIEELEERSKGRKETKKHVARSNDDKFQEKFREVFGDCTLEELKNRLDVAIGKCLDGFDKVENKNQNRMQEQRKSYEAKFERMQKKIDCLQKNEDDLQGNLKTLKLNKHLSEIEEHQLERASIELKRLQKLILALYTQWHQERGEGEKRLLKLAGGLSENYSYEEMVRYIVDYGRKYSTNEKLNDYLFKVLRGIQKLRRTIYPEQCNQKLDPLATLDRIEKWVKFRVTTPSLSKKHTVSQSRFMAEE